MVPYPAVYPLIHLWFLKWIKGIRGIENLQLLEKDKPFLVIANHPTWFDYIFQISALAIILKKEFMVLVDWHVGLAVRCFPILRPLSKHLKMIFINTKVDCRLKNVAYLIDQMKTRNWSVWIYPRGKEDRPKKARYGASLLALLTDCQILPVNIWYDQVSLERPKGNWINFVFQGLRQLMATRNKIYLTIGQPYRLSEQSQEIEKLLSINYKQLLLGLQKLMTAQGSERVLIGLRQICQKIMVESYLKLTPTPNNISEFAPL